MARYALIRTADGRVLNVIEYDGSATYTPTSGTFIRDGVGAEIGDVWNGSSFVAGPSPAPPADQVAFDAAVTQLRATFNQPRTAPQINNSIDALTILLRRAFRELQ